MTFKEELEAVLESQLETLNVLKNITEKKSHILIEENLEALVGITKDEEELINRVGILEVEREKLFDTWGMKVDIPLTNIIANLPEDEGKELRLLGQELYETLKSIDEINKLNNQLLSDNMEWIEFNLNLLTNVQTPSTYGTEEGNVKSNNSLFDRKV